MGSKLQLFHSYVFVTYSVKNVNSNYMIIV